MRHSRIVVGLTAMAAVMSASPAFAFTWQNRADRLLIATRLAHWTKFCVGFGFTPKAILTPEQASSKIYSYLLLSSTPNADVEKWGSYLAFMDPNAGNAKVNSDRAGAAIAAAVIDPSNYQRSKELYKQSVDGTFDAILTECEAASRDPFINANYFDGHGSVDSIKTQMKSDFDAKVAELKAEKRK